MTGVVTTPPFAASEDDTPGPAGAVIVFFSGGTALREVSRELTRFTRNALYLITPFDSGGSTAELRRCFHMPAVGDLRNRMVALAGPRRPTELADLFSHRFDIALPEEALHGQLDALCAGESPWLSALAPDLRTACSSRFVSFRHAMPSDFRLRGACLGNLLVTGAYLEAERSLRKAVLSLGALLDTQGLVLPVVEDSLHLAARLENGALIVGQHLFTGKEAPPITSPIRSVRLTAALPGSLAAPPAYPAAPADVLDRIREADLICYPMGSFYSSLIAALLPAGIGKAIAEADCPKLFVPNVGCDPEELGLDARGRVRELLRVLRADAGEVATSRLLTHVLLDMEQDIDPRVYPGLHVRRAPLSVPGNPAMHDAPRVAELLASLVLSAR